jgi:hypothetical protein
MKAMIKNGEPVQGPIGLGHILLTCTGDIDIEFVRDRVRMFEDVLQKEIGVVGIDYVGLMKKKGFTSRYGALSQHIEDFKAYLTNERKAGIATTQVQRPVNEEAYFECPSFYGAKDSGSIENSTQLLLRVWKTDPDDSTKMAANVGKYSHDDWHKGDVELVVTNGLRIESASKWRREREARMRESEKRPAQQELIPDDDDDDYH